MASDSDKPRKLGDYAVDGDIGGLKREITSMRDAMRPPASIGNLVKEITSLKDAVKAPAPMTVADMMRAPTGTESTVPARRDPGASKGMATVAAAHALIRDQVLERVRADELAIALQAKLIAAREAILEAAEAVAIERAAALAAATEARRAADAEWERKLEEVKRGVPKAVAESIEIMKEEHATVRNTLTQETALQVAVVAANAILDAARVMAASEKDKADTARASAKELEDTRVAGAQALATSVEVERSKTAAAGEKTKRSAQVWVAIIGVIALLVGAATTYAVQRFSPSASQRAAPHEAKP